LIEWMTCVRRSCVGESRPPRPLARLIPAQVDSMTPNTVNALLKDAEEPHRTWCALTSAERESAANAASRCQLRALTRSPDGSSRAAETDWQVARRAGSRPPSPTAASGLGRRAHEHPECARQRARQLDQIIGLNTRDRDESMEPSQATLGRWRNLPARLEVWILWWRDVTLSACGRHISRAVAQTKMKAERRGMRRSRSAPSVPARLLAAQTALARTPTRRLTFDV